jgi:hypothetical protein
MGTKHLPSLICAAAKFLFGSMVVVIFLKYIKIIFFIFKNLFLTSTHQNDLKLSKKNINLKLKKLIFFKNIFKTQKQTDVQRYIKIFFLVKNLPLAYYIIRKFTRANVIVQKTKKKNVC